MNTTHLTALTAVFALSSLFSGAAQEPVNLSPVWQLLPGDRDYLTADNTERGMAYSGTTGNIYVVSRADGLAIPVIDAETGDHVGELDVTGISGGTFDLNMIGVADDGAIYAGNLTTNAANESYRLYRWANEDASPTQVYSGDPGFEPGQRWGDNIAVRGAGEATQVLILSHSFTADSNATVLTPSGGSMDSFSDTWIQQFIGPMGLGSAFGAGDVFWGTHGGRGGAALNEIAFDLGSGSGTLLRSFGMEGEDVVDPALVEIGPIAVDPDANLLAGVREETFELFLYDIDSLEEGQENQPLDVRELPSQNSSPGGSTGDLAFAGGFLYVMHGNNGVLAYEMTELTELESWRLTHFGTTENEGDAANGATPAGDGLFNLVKFALGLDPHVPARDQSPAGAGDEFVEPLWMLQAGERDYLPSSGNTERGMDYNPVNGNVYIVSRAGGELNVAILDGETGDHLGFLDVSGIDGGTFDLNTIGVADDGAIYAGNLTTDAASTPYRLYRWAEEDAAPIEVYTGEPGAEDGGRWGDNIAVSGAGDGTRVLVLSHSGADSQQTLLHPDDGDMEAFAPTPLTPGIAPMGIGTAFGAENRFWGTRREVAVHEVSYDLQSGDASLVRSFGLLDGNPVDDALLDMSLIDIQTEENLLGGFAFATSSLYLYDIGALEEGVENTPLVSFTMPTPNPGAASGLGGVAFAEDRIFAMPANNGIVALRLVETEDETIGFETAAFQTLIFTRPTAPPGGITYVVEASDDLLDWSAETVELVTEAPSDEEGRSILLFRDTVPVADNDRRFMRLRVVED